MIHTLVVSVQALLFPNVPFLYMGDVIFRRVFCHQQIKDIVKEEQEHPEHKDVNAFVLVVMSHGHAGGVSGTDWATVRWEELFTPFDGENCSLLHGKPKIFLIQACRGGTSHDGTT